MSWFTDGLNAIGLYGNTPGDQRKIAKLNEVGADTHYVGNQNADRFFGMDGRVNGALDALQAQSQGKNLVSSEMLRQGMQQGLNAQQSMAAGASPQNAAMAARGAANNMARLGYGLSGQQALAGMQEQQAAQRAYMDAIGQTRGQYLQGMSIGYGNANQSYGGGLNAQRDPTIASQLAGPIAGLAGMVGLGGGATAAATGTAALKPIAAGYPGAGGYWTPGGR